MPINWRIICSSFFISSAGSKGIPTYISTLRSCNLQRGGITVVERVGSRNSSIFSNGIMYASPHSPPMHRILPCELLRYSHPAKLLHSLFSASPTQNIKQRRISLLLPAALNIGKKNNTRLSGREREIGASEFQHPINIWEKKHRGGRNYEYLLLVSEL